MIISFGGLCLEYRDSLAFSHGVEVINEWRKIYVQILKRVCCLCAENLLEMVEFQKKELAHL